MFSSTLSLILALGGGGCSALCHGHLNPGRDPVLIVEEAGWALGLVWQGAENLAPHWDLIPGPYSLEQAVIPTMLSWPQLTLWCQN
jgi:hypothetical protein